MLRGCDCSSVIHPITFNGTLTETDDNIGDIGMTAPCVPDDFNATELEEKYRINQSSKG